MLVPLVVRAEDKMLLQESGGWFFVLECGFVCLILIFFKEIRMNKKDNVTLLAPYGSMKFKAMVTKVGNGSSKVPGPPPSPPPPVPSPV